MPSATSANVEVIKHPARPGWLLTATQWLPRPVDEVWPFFTDAHNLEAITPAFLKFNVITPRPIEMRAGTLIDYRLVLRGLPIRWRTEISVWEPGRRFMDRQLRGPYLWWEHEHTFEAREGGTLCTDRVAYNVPGWVLAPAVHAMMVKRDVEGIFRFRGEALARRFGAPAAASA